MCLDQAGVAGGHGIVDNLQGMVAVQAIVAVDFDQLAGVFGVAAAAVLRLNRGPCRCETWFEKAMRWVDVVGRLMTGEAVLIADGGGV